MTEIPQSVIEQAAKGDLDSFRIIYDSMKDYVYTIAYRIALNREDAEEATQDIFLNIHKNLKSFHFHSSFKTWVYRIAVNTAINTAKSKARKRGRETPLDEKISLTLTDETASEKMRKENNEVFVENLLSKLNPDQRACVTLKDIKGLSYEEIAGVLKININTVRSRLKRAREKMLQTRKEL